MVREKRAFNDAAVERASIEVTTDVIFSPPVFSVARARACVPQAVERLCSRAPADDARVASRSDLLREEAPVLANQP